MVPAPSTYRLADGDLALTGRSLADYLRSPADGPSSTEADDGRKDHGERDEDTRLADPQLRPGALTRWVERGLDYGVPS